MTCVRIQRLDVRLCQRRESCSLRCRSRKYAPQYGGYCAFGTARGYKADIDPATFTVIDGRLYLNYNTQVQREWAADTASSSARPMSVGRR